MPDPICDFVPDTCSALAIQACIKASKCFTLELDFGASVDMGDTGISATAEANLTITGLNNCVLDGLAAMFANAGCPLPPFPEPPAAPDFTDCKAAMDSILAQTKLEPLAFLLDLMTITLDENDYPTRITVP